MEISGGRKELFEASGFRNHDKVVSERLYINFFSIFVSLPPSAQEMKFPNYVGACTSPVVRPCCTWGGELEARSIGFVRKRSQIPETSNASGLLLTMFFYQVPKN